MPVTYNERSWAIDLITHLNQLLGNQHLGIERAGGEHTIQDASGTLFPDILLFGDQDGQTILQGWELKMPDTPITNAALIDNAERKARTLRLNSFVVWNVNQAVLYVADEALKAYEPRTSWSLPGEPADERSDVASRSDAWKALAEDILRDVSQLFQTGVIRDRTLVDTFRNETVIEALFEHVPAAANHLQHVVRTNARFRAEVEEWWHQVKRSYASNSKLDILATRILAGWAAKIIFTHTLKRICAQAEQIEDLQREAVPSDALALFDTISEVCNFLTVYRQSLGEGHIGEQTWTQLLQVNQFFSELELGGIGSEATQALLHSTVSTAKRKAAGQFTTPQNLARLLVRVSMKDQTGIVLDPCCGTGTIPAAAYDEKRASGLSAHAALSSVWASDKFAFPLQAATLALARPEHMGAVQHVFQNDVMDLKVGDVIPLRDPSSGKAIEKPLPTPDFIISNLPFVQFEDVADTNPTIDHINERLREYTDAEVHLPGRSDLYAYLPFYLWTLLEPGGHAGLILSNSWLGTDWGRDFRRTLQRFYHIKKVIVSGRGRWFQDADVVTTLLLLQKRENIDQSLEGEKTSFITVLKAMDELNTDDDHRLLSSRITLNKEAEGWTHVQQYTSTEIERVEEFGVEWSGLFADASWLSNIEDTLIPAHKLFDIGRGERRGWNALFYPSEGHGIEDEYIEPGLKSPASAEGLIATPDIDVFSCSRSIEALETRGDHGALQWIRKFKHETNGTGTPLPEVLDRSDMHWYELRTDTMADLVLPVNPYQRLFVPKLQNRSFVDQRFTRFTLRNENLCADLCHALMNSIVGLFLIEALGFGRGLGALDLSTTRAKRQLHMLDPQHLDTEQKSKVMRAFRPLLERPVKPLAEELSRNDRNAFDEIVLDAYGIRSLHTQIQTSLNTLYQIRMAARD